MKTLKIMAALLAYPTESLVKAVREVAPILTDEKWLSKENITSIKTLIKYLQVTDLFELQEGYVALFDRTPSLSLHMFEHVHGDSRERGQAMVDLAQMYEEQGLEIGGHETPDFLPMFLEYLSVLDTEEASQCLGETVNVLAMIAKRLEQRESPYAAVFNALQTLAKTAPSEKIVKEAIAKADGSPFSNDEIDANWEEAAAFGGTSDCATACPPNSDATAYQSQKPKIKINLEEAC